MTAQQFMNYIDTANPDKVLAVMLLALILWLIKGYISWARRRIYYFGMIEISEEIRRILCHGLITAAEARGWISNAE